MFHAMTAQPAPALMKPDPPKPAPPMTLQSLLGDQLLKANIPANQRVSDQALNTLINATPAPANYGPRKTVEDPHSAAAIVAQLDRALQQQRKADHDQKVRYGNIAAAHNPVSPRVQQQQQRDNNSYGAESAESYSMATFVSRLEKIDNNPANGNQPAHSADNNMMSPPKLDFSKLTPAKNANKPTSSNSDPYSIDVHALKLPDINSPQTQAYYQSQKQPILCIYSPAPVEGKTPAMSPYTSPERGSPSPTSSPAHAHGHSGSPVQLHGTLTSSTPHHTASSPAIMYIQSPSLVQERKSLAPKESMQSLRSAHSLHNQSAASLPIVSSTHGASSQNLNNHLNHHYQTHAEYQHALHPQTQAFLNNMLHTTNPDFHDDPRNYRHGDNDSVMPYNSVAELEESIYDYEQEFLDLNAEPVGDSGRVDLSTESNRFLLPTNTVEQGGHALLDLGYQYQHSTGTYVHKDERNRSKFGQYERSPLPDPYAADFSDRHLEAIVDTTVGHGPAVIYIPPGAPAAEPTIEKKPSAFQQLTNRFTGNKLPTPSVVAHSPAAVPFGNINNKPKYALEAGEVVQDHNYGGVRTIMQHPRDTPLSAIHYRGGKGGQAGVNLDVNSDGEEDAEGEEGFHNNNNANHRLSMISADNSTLHSHYASGGDIKQEINDYIAKLKSHAPSNYNNYNNGSAGNTVEPSVYTDQDYCDGSTVQSHDRAAERARVKLWDKLNNRYAGDREGEFVRKQAIKEYVYGGIKQDTQIMHEYMEEMDEGWKL